MIKSKNPNNLFTEKRLKDIYFKTIKENATPGSDGINIEKFNKKLDEEINIILKKVPNNKYKFSPYLGNCISKGPDAYPRLIQKPTIRDKLLLRCLFEFLDELYSIEIAERSLHKQIKNMIQEINSHKYNHIIRRDVQNFFPSVDHNLLITKLEEKIKKKEILNLLISAIKNPNDLDKKEERYVNEKGIPQGLSISNILSNVFLFDLDKKYSDIEKIKYFRFVDDILILCNQEDCSEINIMIENDFKRLKLELHDGYKKNVSQSINKEFDFLGYSFIDGKIGVRKTSKENIKKSIISIFTSYKYSKRNISLLQFKINLRITGCIIDGKKYGWLFYFSQLTDKTIVYSLDSFVKKQFLRYNVSCISIKKFVRTLDEIKFNLNETKYIPKFDLYTIDEMKELISLFAGKEIKDSEEIKKFFYKIIYKEIKLLEKDMGKIS